MINKIDDKQIFVERYQLLEKIGEGGFGIVYKALDQKTNEFVAIKKIKLDNDGAISGINQDALREVSILSDIRHPNIVKLLDTIYKSNENELYLVFEHMPTDLLQFLRQKENLIYPLFIKSCLWQILQALSYCHARGIVHRDIKPSNIFLSNEGIIKIGDFGLSKPYQFGPSNLTPGRGTLCFKAPEILLGQQFYDNSADIWSLGCLFAEMVEKCTLFFGKSEIDQLFKIFQFFGMSEIENSPNVISSPNFRLGIFPNFEGIDRRKSLKYFDDNGFDLLIKMLVPEPTRRISASTALKHQYFDQLDKSVLPDYKLINTKKYQREW